MIVLVCWTWSWWLSTGRPRLTAPEAAGDETGQATAEYALVLLAVATIALALVAWATQSGRIGDLLDAVFDAITAKF